MIGKWSSTTAFKNQNTASQLQMAKCKRSDIFCQTIPELRGIFVNKLINLPIEQRYTAVKIHSLELCLTFRKLFRQLQMEKYSEKNIQKIENSRVYSCQKILKDTNRPSSRQIKAFYQGIVFMSDQDHLDCVCFDYTLIQHPQKLFDFLNFLTEQSQNNLTLNDLVLQRQSFNSVIQSLKKIDTREELVISMAKILRQQVIPNIILYVENGKLNTQKNRKRDFTQFWKSLSEQARHKLLFLNKKDQKQLLNCLLDCKSLLPPPQQFAKQIQELMKSQKHQACNKVFKSKLKKSFILLEDYHELVFKSWRQEVQKKKKQRHKNKSKKSKYQKIKKTKSGKDLDLQSNQTNETQCNRQKQYRSFEIQQLSKLKINADILQFADSISTQANQGFQCKVQAFSRLQYLLQSYFHVQTHLFGSLTCGLAVKSSDIDAAIDQSFLDRQQFYFCSPEQRIRYALEYLGSHLELRPWIKNLKVISTAAIPIINFTIDISIPICQCLMSQEDFLRLNQFYLAQNESRSCEVDIDLTIQNKQQCFGPIHLGQPSTIKLKQWLNQTQYLQELTLIFKHYLTNLNLNNTYKGGLKTYSLVILILAYIKAYSLEHAQSIQSLMRGITKFYGYQFDQFRYGIDITNEHIFYQKKDTQNGMSAPLEIKDPINQRIMTKSCYSFHQIKRMMRQIHQRCFEYKPNQVNQVQTYYENNETSKVFHLAQISSNQIKIEKLTQRQSGNKFETFLASFKL